jgi:hypothetical protein
VAHHARNVLIHDLDARARFDERLARLACIGTGRGPAAGRVRAFLFSPLESVIEYLEAGLRLVMDILELPVHISRSSSLGIDPSLRGQARVIEPKPLVSEFTCGGFALYDADNFASAGIPL